MKQWISYDWTPVDYVTNIKMGVYTYADLDMKGVAKVDQMSFLKRWVLTVTRVK